MSNRIRVAVTGAGGGVGQSIIKSLQDSEYDVVALDSHPLATGLYAAPRAHLVPAPHEPSYIDHLIDLCRAERCRVLFPGLDTELAALSRARAAFERVGTTVVVSTPDVVECSDNKLLTHQVLSKHDVPVPATVDLTQSPRPAAPPRPGAAGLEPPLPYPFIVKRRTGGSRSRDVHLVRDDHDLATVAGQLGDPSAFIAQQYIEGDEYTCGSVNLDGQCHGVIAMRRTLRDGDTYKCFVTRNAVVEETTTQVARALRPFGACNVQLRVDGGTAYVFEINARCSGTTAARSLSGFNEPRMITDFICHGRPPAFRIQEQTILRYWTELVVPDDDVAAMASTGSRHQSRERTL